MTYLANLRMLEDVRLRRRSQINAGFCRIEDCNNFVYALRSAVGCLAANLHANYEFEIVLCALFFKFSVPSFYFVLSANLIDNHLTWFLQLFRRRENDKVSGNEITAAPLKLVGY